MNHIARWAAAVVRGDKVFAHPETAERLNVAIERAGLPYRVEPSEYIPRGDVYAINVSLYTETDHLEKHDGN